ncbi:hypothetical protein FRC09_010909 [Ceratobasidium sp. 395]|nr:hypothetical protein FRC09_010909 [Ceratobasidium sp. 395]
MPSFSKIVTVAVACVLLAGPSAATSAFSRRHSRRTPTQSSEHVIRAKNAKSQHRDGSATYYNVEENTGACGEFHNNGEYVAAIGKTLWSKTSDGQGRSTMCGKTGTVSWQGKNVDVMFVDECEGCDENSLDLSPTAFTKLAPQGSSPV